MKNPLIKSALHLLLILLSTLPLSRLAAAQNVSSVLANLTEDNAPSELQANHLITGNRIIPATAVQSGDPVSFLLGPPSNTTVNCSQLLIGRASYKLAVDASYLNTSVFENVDILKYLMGEDTYTITSAVNQGAMLRFHAERVSPLGFLGSTITSDATMLIYEWNQTPPQLKAAVNNLTHNALPPERLIWQKIGNFKNYINNSFLLTLIYKDPNGSRIELYSASTLTDADQQLPVIVNSVINSLSRKDLVGYVGRLAAYVGQLQK